MPEIKILLKPILVEYNMTQKELAERTGLRSSTISEMANNTRSTINKDHLLVVMKALDIQDISRILKVV